MSLKMFLADYCEDKASDVRPSSKDEILHSMDCVLHMPRNYIGVTDENGVTLQFMVNEDKSTYVDIPAPAERGSYAKTTDLQDCLTIMRVIGEAIDAKTIDELAFQAW